MTKEQSIDHDADGQMIETSAIDCTTTEKAWVNRVSFAAFFWHVTPGALRDMPKVGCEGD